VTYSLQKLLSENVVLPTLPTLYAALMKALQSPESSLSDIAAIIAKDDMMAEKMLRLINSAFYGYIQNINQAVSYLGAEAISSIALTAALYEQFLEGDYPDFDIQASYDHSISVGATAGRWITATQKNRKLSEEATMAGMTHDFGKLVLVRNRPELWHEASEWAAKKNVPMSIAEHEVMGTSHAEIGAYLLNQWGVSDNILEAVAYHHHPAHSMTREKNALFAVHLANVLCHKWHDPAQDWKRGFDEKYFHQVDPQASFSQCEADAGDVK
jgi:HD-like signal output (HDOD) protein